MKKLRFHAGYYGHVFAHLMSKKDFWVHDK